MQLTREQSHSGHTTSLCGLATLEALMQLGFLAGVKSPHVAKIREVLGEWERERRRGTNVSYQSLKFQMFICQLSVGDTTVID